MTDSSQPKVFGYLHKKKEIVLSSGSLKLDVRWFELDFKKKILGYKVSNNDEEYKKKYNFKEIINCNTKLSLAERKLSTFSNGFKIYTKKCAYILFAKDQEEMDKWLIAIHIVLALNQKLFEPVIMFDSESKYRNKQHKRSQSLVMDENFEKKKSLLKSDFIEGNKVEKVQNVKNLYDIFNNVDVNQVDISESFLVPKYELIQSKEYKINENDIADFNFYDKNNSRETNMKNPNKEMKNITGDIYSKNKYLNHYLERVNKKSGEPKEKIENLLNDYYVNNNNQVTNTQKNVDEKQTIDRKLSNNSIFSLQDSFQEINVKESQKGSVKQLILNNESIGYNNNHNNLFLNNYDPKKFYEFGYMDFKKLKPGEVGPNQGKIKIDGVNKMNDCQNKLKNQYSQCNETAKIVQENYNQNQNSIIKQIQNNQNTKFEQNNEKDIIFTNINATQSFINQVPTKIVSNENKKEENSEIN